MHFLPHRERKVILSQDPPNLPTDSLADLPLWHFLPFCYNRRTQDERIQHQYLLLLSQWSPAFSYPVSFSIFSLFATNKDINKHANMFWELTNTKGSLLNKISHLTKSFIGQTCPKSSLFIYCFCCVGFVFFLNPQTSVNYFSIASSRRQYSVKKSSLVMGIHSFIHVFILKIFI